MISLVRATREMVRLLSLLVSFILREDVQKLIALLVRYTESVTPEKWATAVDLAVRLLNNAEHTPQQDPLRDAKYAADRIGVVVKTIDRLVAKGILPVHSIINAKRMFRESDIERCRRYYRGG